MTVFGLRGDGSVIASQGQEFLPDTNGKKMQFCALFPWFKGLAGLRFEVAMLGAKTEELNPKALFLLDDIVFTMDISDEVDEM